MPGVLVQPLVGVDAELARLLQLQRAARPHPLVEQVAHQPLAQLDVQIAVQPALRDVEHQQRAGDPAEHHELVQEVGHVLALDGVVEGLVPAVEQHLAEGGRHDQRQDAEAHPEEQASHRRAEEGPPHHHQLLAKIRIAGRDAARRGRLALARARSTSAAAPIRSNLIRHSQTSRARRRHPCAWQVCRTDGNVGIRAGATRRGKPVHLDKDAK